MLFLLCRPCRHNRQRTQSYPLRRQVSSLEALHQSVHMQAGILCTALHTRSSQWPFREEVPLGRNSSFSCSSSLPFLLIHLSFSQICFSVEAFLYFPGWHPSRPFLGEGWFNLSPLLWHVQLTCISQRLPNSIEKNNIFSHVLQIDVSCLWKAKDWIIQKSWVLWFLYHVHDKAI